MWTMENRGRYDRSKLRYPSDLSDEEWALTGPLIPPAKRGGNRRTVNAREVVNGLMYVLSTGCQWRAIPKDLPPCDRRRSSICVRLRVRAIARPAHLSRQTAEAAGSGGENKRFEPAMGVFFHGIGTPLGADLRPIGALTHF